MAFSNDTHFLSRFLIRLDSPYLTISRLRLSLESFIGLCSEISGVIFSTTTNKRLAPRRIRQFLALLDALKTPALLLDSLQTRVSFSEQEHFPRWYKSYAKKDNGNYRCLRFPKRRRVPRYADLERNFAVVLHPLVLTLI